MGCPHCRYPFTLPPKGVVIRMEPIPTSTFTRECSNCGSLFAFEVRQIRGPAREDFPRQKVEHNGKNAPQDAPSARQDALGTKDGRPVLNSAVLP